MNANEFFALIFKPIHIKKPMAEEAKQEENQEQQEENASETPKKEDRSAYNCPDCGGEGLDANGNLCQRCGGYGKLGQQ